LEVFKTTLFKKGQCVSRTAARESEVVYITLRGEVAADLIGKDLPRPAGAAALRNASAVPDDGLGRACCVRQGRAAGAFCHADGQIRDSVVGRQVQLVVDNATHMRGTVRDRKAERAGGDRVGGVHSPLRTKTQKHTRRRRRRRQMKGKGPAAVGSRAWSYY
jgi:hypothetical protein